ncbi:MAG: hypothetical protein EAZ91_14125 [Cytophagales bacterium]|nr:MAG: hypothetical protein EAZ91_14125 [Cytophagales bacterium]
MDEMPVEFSVNGKINLTHILAANQINGKLNEPEIFDNTPGLIEGLDGDTFKAFSVPRNQWPYLGRNPVVVETTNGDLYLSRFDKLENDKIYIAPDDTSKDGLTLNCKDINTVYVAENLHPTERLHFVDALNNNYEYCTEHHLFECIEQWQKGSERVNRPVEVITLMDLSYESLKAELRTAKDLAELEQIQSEIENSLQVRFVLLPQQISPVLSAKYQTLLETRLPKWVALRDETNERIKKLTPSKIVSVFADLLNPQNVNVLVLMSYLKRDYRNLRKKKKYAYLLYALHDLGYLLEHPDEMVKDKLIELLKSEFDNVGTRQNIESHLHNIRYNAKAKDRAEIQAITNHIKSSIRNDNTV